MAMIVPEIIRLELTLRLESIGNQHFDILLTGKSSRVFKMILSWEMSEICWVLKFAFVYLDMSFSFVFVFVFVFCIETHLLGLFHFELLSFFKGFVYKSGTGSNGIGLSGFMMLDL